MKTLAIARIDSGRRMKLQKCIEITVAQIGVFRKEGFLKSGQAELSQKS
jgi:hypothetical protein